MSTKDEGLTVSPNDSKPIITRSQFLVDNDIYVELAVGQKWCFKFQPKGKPIIMCSYVEKETAAEMMIKELKLAGIDFVLTSVFTQPNDTTN